MQEPAKKHDPKPVWEVQVRPIGASHESWSTMRVQARSILQAEAVLRRRGYEMAKQTAMRPDGQPDLVSPAHLRPLVCASWGYQLSGLMIDRAYVICPECSNPQGLIIWSPELVPEKSPIHGLVIALAIIGGISVVLILFTCFSGILLEQKTPADGSTGVE